MTEPADAARENLAFMRSIVEPGPGAQAMLGESFVAGGLIYGLQTLGHTAQGAHLLPASGPLSLAIGIVPTVVFLSVLGWIGWRHRQARQGGLAARAVGATFGVLGLCNLALMIVIGSVAARQHSLITWLLYPCIVFILQGAGWMIAGMIRRRGWMVAVGLGWFVTAVVMALSIDSWGFPTAAAVGLFGLMMVPGFVLLRLARAGA